MKKLMSAITIIAGIMLLIGAASMDSEHIILPAILTFTSALLLLVISRVYWRLS